MSFWGPGNDLTGRNRKFHIEEAQELFLLLFISVGSRYLLVNRGLILIFNHASNFRKKERGMG